MKQIKDSYLLSNGVELPCIGYGTYKAADGNDCDIIKMAMEAGYQYFDTASFYGTESYIAQAMKESGKERKDCIIASKVWKDEMGYEQTKEAFQRTLERLDTDYLDLYLIHWPLPSPDYREWKQLNVDTWRAMEELYKAGKVRAIGVSNFLPHHIENLIEHGSIVPMLNQLEVHVGYTQEAAVQYCKEHNIQVQAWSPIGRTRVLQEPLILELAKKYEVSPAQICIRFLLQKGIMPLPKSSSLERMKQNQDVFTFEISQEDMYRLDTLPQIGWSGEHPDRERVR